MSEVLVHVLLDVDGVINAVRRGLPPRDGWDRHKRYKHEFGRWDGSALDGSTGSFVIRYSPDLVEALNEIAARPDVRFHWLTTWLTEARYGLSRRIGLHGTEWPVLGASEKATWGGTDTWWKLKAAQAQAAANPDTRIVWVDDDLIFDREAVDWIESAFPRVLLISPESEVGLTPADIRRIRTWIDTGDIDE